MITMKGAAVSAKLKEQVEKGLETLTWVPKLTIIRVGENPDDMSYERGATKKMESFGLRVQSYVYPEDITDSDFKAEFTRINEDPDVTGILMLRPLPKQICEKDIEGMIDEKAMDRTKSIILSMTPQERSNPSILNISRKNRIARGAGVDVSEVNRVVKQFEQSKKMMKQMPGLMGGKAGKRSGGFKLPFGL